MNYKQAIEIVKKQRIYFTNRSQLEVEEKSRANYVTNIDKTIENSIKEELAIVYPHIDFVGEEELENKTSSLYWLLDPIDGTQNYIKRQYPSMISLALVENDIVTFALIYDPYFDDVYEACIGQGAYLNGQRISVSDNNLEKAIIMLGTSPYNRNLSKKTFTLARNVFENVSDIRRSGSACYDLVQVATGRADGYVELIVQSWDFAAGYLLVKEAGGVLSNIEGQSLNKIKVGPTSIVASNKRVHDELIVLIAKAS